MARELITIAKYSLPYQADLARNALQHAGIPVVLSVNETALSLLTAIKLQVAPSDCDRAREVLQELAGEQTGSPLAPWTCPKCGVECPGEFDACFQCGTGRDGTEDPEFASLVDRGPQSPPIVPAWRATPPQFGLRHLMLVMTAFSLLFTIGYWLGPASIMSTLFVGVSALVIVAMLSAVNELRAHRLSTSPGLRYRRLCEAHSWGRWQNALRLLEPLRDLLPRHLVAYFEACALSGLGRVDEALQVIEPFAGGDLLPRQHFWSLLMASVRHIAGHYELELAAREKAAELAPEDPVILIDLANAVLSLQQDAKRATELLERASQQPIPDLALPFRLAAKGMIALEVGNPRMAVKQLENALRVELGFAHSSALLAANADFIEARLALAKALAGDLKAAKKHFRRAHRRLRALNERRLLERCQRALGEEVDRAPPLTMQISTGLN